MVASLSKMDRTPFHLEIPSLIPLTNTEMNTELESELVVIELQDCSLGDAGALAVANALNAFVTQEAKRASAVIDLRKKKNAIIKMR